MRTAAILGALFLSVAPAAAETQFWCSNEFDKPAMIDGQGDNALILKIEGQPDLLLDPFELDSGALVFDGGETKDGRIEESHMERVFIYKGHLFRPCHN